MSMLNWARMVMVAIDQMAKVPALRRSWPMDSARCSPRWRDQRVGQIGGVVVPHRPFGLALAHPRAH